MESPAQQVSPSEAEAAIRGFRRIGLSVLGLITLALLAMWKADAAFAWACAIISVPASVGLLAEHIGVGRPQPVQGPTEVCDPHMPG